MRCHIKVSKLKKFTNLRYKVNLTDEDIYLVTRDTIDRPVLVETVSDVNKRIFNINVGQPTAKQIEDYIRKIRDLMRSRPYL